MMRALLPFFLLLQAPAEPPRLPIESYTLDNGLKVILQPDPSVPRVAVCVAYHVGSKDEKAGRTGFAHFFEHMMFRGTAQAPNYDIPLQEAGGESNAFTTEDMTVYFEVVTREFLERALYLEANRLGFLASALDQDKFDTEREVVKNERRQGVDNVPYGLAEETILASLFPPGHPYSWSVIGSIDDLNRATLDDLKAFFATHYHPGNAALSLSGDFDPAEARTLIARYFSPLPPGPARPADVVTVVPPVDVRIQQTDVVTLPRTHWVWPTVADNHADAPALDLLADLLSAGDASRLKRSLVRERRVASKVSASADGREVAGTFQITATPAEGKTIEDLEAAIAEELHRLVADPPTEAELQRVLAQYQKSAYDRLAGTLGRAMTLAIGAARDNDPEYYREDIRRHLAVTPADLARVAARYLTPKKLVLVIKPGDAKSTPPKAGPDPSAAETEAAPRTPEGDDQLDWTKLPGPTPAGEFRPPVPVRRTLSNGLDVWFLRWPTLPLAEAVLSVPAGSAHDPVDKPGLASLTAELAIQGTETRTATEFAESLDALGGGVNTRLTADDAQFFISGLSTKFEPVLALVAEALQKPRLDPEDLARERELLITDLKRGPDDPNWIAGRVYPGLLYGFEHPYGRPTDGQISAIEGASRAEVSAFHKTTYVPRGARLVIAGDLDPDTLMPMLERTLGRWTSADGPASSKWNEPTPDAAKPGVVYLVDKPDAAQSVLRVGRLWTGYDDPRRIPLELGNRVLGGSFLSRLNQNLRENKGYTYGAGSRIAYPRRGGRWVVGTSVRTDATGPALREIVNELSALGQGGDRALTESEIDDNRAAEATSWPDAFGSPGSLVPLLDDLAKHDRPVDELAGYLEQLRAAPVETIRSTLADLTNPSEQIILIVGDRAKVEPQLREAGFKQIEVLTPEGKPSK